MFASFQGFKYYQTTVLINSFLVTDEFYHLLMYLLVIWFFLSYKLPIHTHCLFWRGLFDIFLLIRGSIFNIFNILGNNPVCLSYIEYFSFT